MIDLRYGNDAIDVLREMPAESVHVCVTSPPYFGLRDYGTMRWEGGAEDCEHSIASDSTSPKAVFSDRVTRGKRDACLKCGAVRIDQQIGLEPTLQEFIAKLVAVFAEVHRVLHPSGTLWVNIGDSYNAHPGQRKTTDKVGPKQETNGGSNTIGSRNVVGMKPKDLMMVPSRFAIAMQDWGWYLRDFIVWAKPAPMPESVTDRCTKAWEPIFMFAKSPRYYADMEAVRTASDAPIAVYEGSRRSDDIATLGLTRGTGNKSCVPLGGANLRNVWTLPPESFPGKHFATFPSELPRKCILIGSSAKGCCPHCLAPWARVTERFDTGRKQKAGDGWDTGEGAHGTIHRSGRSKGETGVPVMADKTVGWAASCQCQHTEADTIPCRVLDPFSGSGTTGRVAFDLGRDYIGIDLNKEYEPLARERIGGLFIS